MAAKHWRLARWVTGIAAGLALFASVWMWKVAWLSPAHYRPGDGVRLGAPIMSAEEYDGVLASHARPYVYRATIGNGEALVFGAEHTKDPANRQIAELKEKFAAFSPTVVLVEGRPGSPVAGLSDPVRQFGEMGMAMTLARRAGAMLWSWEPSREDETGAMLRKFPKERVALFYILRPYVSNLRHGKPADPDATLEAIRAKRSEWAGLEGTLASVGAIDAVWARDFKGLPDWRDTSDEFGWPGYLSEIADASRDVRTEQMARCVLDLCGKGERVLVVCGASHAVRARGAITGE